MFFLVSPFSFCQRESFGAPDGVLDSVTYPGTLGVIMRDWFSQPPAEPIRPDYNIYHYTGGIYKIVNFKSTAPRLSPPVRSETLKYDNKLVQSLSRARRVVLELALCNDWAYFCTFTLDPTKYKRDDLPKFQKDFSGWIRDQRKKYRKAAFDLQLDYVLVPEEHKDGAWHMHGLFSDLTPFIIPFYCERHQGKIVPDKLIAGGFFNWPDYQKKFGFCSLGKIRNRVATGFYITKYITKQIDNCKLPPNAHAYYASTNLNRSSFHGEIYGYCDSLDRYLTNDYDFCRTGFTNVKDGLSWDFALEYMDYDLIEPLNFSEAKIEAEVDQYWEYTQSALAGFNEEIL